MQNINDYESHEGAAGSSDFIRLKEKDQTVRVRLLGMPITYQKTYVDENKKSTVKDEYWWLAVDLTEATEKKDPSKAKVGIFTGGPFIYNIVRQLARDGDWGDPTKYDIKFTRTEKKGQFYSAAPVQPKTLPKEVDAIIADFLKENEASNVMDCLERLYQKIVEKKEFDKATSGDTTDEYNPFEDE